MTRWNTLQSRKLEKRVSQNVKEILSARFVGMKSVSPGIHGLDDESSWEWLIEMHMICKGRRYKVAVIQKITLHPHQILIWLSFELRHSIASKPLYLKVKISTARLIDILVLKSGFQKENEIDKPQTMTDFPLPAIHDKKLWRSQEGAGEVLPTRMAKGGKKCKQESEKEN